MSDDVTKDGDFNILAIFKRFSSNEGRSSCFLGKYSPHSFVEEF